MARDPTGFGSEPHAAAWRLELAAG